MACPVCRRARCVWVELKDPKTQTIKRLYKVLDHNNDYIEMIFRDGCGSAAAEEKMYAALSPYSDEIEKRITAKAQGEVE